MKCPVCLTDLRIEGTLAGDYGYCPQCLKYRKLSGAIKEGQELTIQQRLSVIEARLASNEQSIEDIRQVISKIVEILNKKG